MNDIERMQLSLTGLSVGDAFWETLSRLSSLLWRLELREAPLPPGHYTDDTEISLDRGSSLPLLSDSGT